MWGNVFRGTLLSILCIAAAYPVNAQEPRPIYEVAEHFDGPHSRTGAAAWGDSAFIFGGSAVDAFGRSANEIWRFDSKTETLHLVAARLPIPLISPAVVSTPQGIYVLGGLSGVDLAPQRTIFKFDAEAETLTVVPVLLPTPGAGTAAWDGSAIYFLPSPGYNPVTRFDPATGQATALTIITPSEWGTLVATPHGMYYFGGHAMAGGMSDEVWNFEPLDGFRWVATLPAPWGYSGAIWDGNNIYLMGGFSAMGGPAMAGIIAFDPSTNASTVDSRYLPAPSSHLATVNLGGGYAFGGNLTATGDELEFCCERIYCLHCGEPAPPPANDTEPPPAPAPAPGPVPPASPSPSPPASPPASAPTSQPLATSPPALPSEKAEREASAPGATVLLALGCALIALRRPR